MILRAKMGVSVMKCALKLCNFLLCLEEDSVYYSTVKQLLRAYFCLPTGLNKFYHTSAQMGIPCMKCVIKE